MVLVELVRTTHDVCTCDPLEHLELAVHANKLLKMWASASKIVHDLSMSIDQECTHALVAAWFAELGGVILASFVIKLVELALIWCVIEVFWMAAIAQRIWKLGDSVAALHIPLLAARC